MEIDIRYTDNHVVVIMPKGKISIDETIILDNKMKEIVGKENTNILFNLANVDYICSAGLGIIVNYYSLLKNKNGILKLCNAKNKGVKNVLVIAKFNKIFKDLFKSDEQVIKTFFD